MIITDNINLKTYKKLDENQKRFFMAIAKIKIDDKIWNEKILKCGWYGI